MLISMSKEYMPKVLMVACQEIIEEQSDGGKRVTFRNYELLKETFGKDNVYLCMLTNHKGNRKNDSHIIRLTAYKNRCERFANILRGRFFTGEKNEEEIVRFIEKERIRIAFIDRSMFGSLILKIRKASPPCKVWVFAHNLEKNYFANKFKSKPLLSFILCRQVEKSERLNFHQADCIMALTQRDADLISEIYNADVKYIIPSSYIDKFVCDDSNQQSEEKYGIHDDLQLLFIGTMFGPNYEGIKWFIEKVMPQLEHVRLSIVGKNFELKRMELERENVKVIGTVEHLDPYYYSNSVMVMPVFYGDGQKVKTVEALMYGKTILATDESLEGYDVDHVQGIFRCNTADEFVKVINELRKTGIPKENCICVRRVFLEKYSFQHIVEQYKRVLLDEYAKSN